ncbi:MAG: winged helix-turn-helix domain-containing tetratricopeptide repeat protein [Bryobacteraceae bacterium]
MPVRAPRRLRFGVFEVDLHNRELRKSGVNLKLQQKPFQVLELLLRSPGEFVSRAELAQHLWPQLHVSFDRSLNTAVNVLRQVLGDSSRSFRYIETRSGLGYRFIGQLEEINEPTVNPPLRGSTDSIAILPFENLTGDSNVGLVADGVAEGVISALSSLEHLRVIARTTAFRFRGPEHEPQAVGDRLKVRLILSSRVSYGGSSLIISTELIEVQTGTRLWGERYSRMPSEIFGIERNITAQILKVLNLPSDVRPSGPLKKNYTANLEAHQDYLKGRYFFNKMSEEDLRKSIAHFEAALRQDPDYSPAYTGLADAYSMFALLGVFPPRDAYRRVKQLVTIALELDQQLAEAHASLANMKAWFEKNWPAAESAFLKALELNANYADGHRWYAAHLSSMGRAEEALKEIRTAQELDPLSLVTNMEVAWSLYMARDFRAALEQSWKTLVLEPRFAAAQHTLGLAYGQLGMMDEAVTEFQNAHTCSGGHPATIAALGHAHAIAGNQAAASEALDELQQLSKRRYVSPYWRGLVYAGIRMDDLALESLEKACEDADVWSVWLKVEPRLDPLRSNTRFHKLLSRLRLDAQTAPTYVSAL